jgi:hypothetical protein
LPPKTAAVIDQSLVRAVREASAYGTLKGVFPGFAPEKVDYPFAVYVRLAAPIEDDWTNRMYVAAYQVAVFSRNEVDAKELDQSIADALEGAQLTIDGMSSLICTRVADLPTGVELDAKGIVAK